MTEAPEPLADIEVDLHDFPSMPLDVLRLRDSDLATLATGEEFKAAVLLWCASWHQVPAGSLPSDERMLARLVGLGRDIEGWRTIAPMALRGFIECNDGRLYHPVVVEKALAVFEKRKKQSARTANATKARLAKQRNVQRDVPRDVRRDVQQNAHQGKDRIGEERNKTHGRSGDRPSGTNGDFETYWHIVKDLRGTHPNPKKPAAEKFAAAIKAGADPAAIIAGAKNFARYVKAEITDRSKVAQAVTWLSQERWEQYQPSAEPERPQAGLI